MTLFYLLLWRAVKIELHIHFSLEKCVDATETTIMDAFDQLMCYEDLNDSLDDFVLPGLNRITHAATLFKSVSTC